MNSAALAGWPIDLRPPRASTTASWRAVFAMAAASPPTRSSAFAHSWRAIWTARRRDASCSRQLPRRSSGCEACGGAACRIGSGQ